MINKILSAHVSRGQATGIPGIVCRLAERTVFSWRDRYVPAHPTLDAALKGARDLMRESGILREDLTSYCARRNKT